MPTKKNTSLVCIHCHRKYESGDIIIGGCHRCHGPLEDIILEEISWKSP